MFRRSFFGAGPWDGARVHPTAQLAGAHKRTLGQGGNGCRIPGTDMKPVFDSNYNGTGACGVVWMDTSNAEYPDCVQAPPDYPGAPADGQWIPPSCASGLSPVPESEPVPEPLPEPTPTTPPPSDSYYQDSFPVSEQCPAGEVWTGLECKPLPEGRAPAACASATKPGMFDLYDVDSGAYLRTVPASVDYPQFPDEPASMASPGFCDTHSPNQAPAPETTPTPPPASTPTQTLPPPPAPGAPVPVTPGPFPAPTAPAPVPVIPTGMPGPMPAPNRSFGPSMRPSCKTVPYQSRPFPTTTYPTRVDQFPDQSGLTF